MKGKIAPRAISKLSLIVSKTSHLDENFSFPKPPLGSTLLCRDYTPFRMPPKKTPEEKKREGRYADQTVVELKKECRGRGLTSKDCTLKRAELVELLQKHDRTKTVGSDRGAKKSDVPRVVMDLGRKPLVKKAPSVKKVASPKCYDPNAEKCETGKVCSAKSGRCIKDSTTARKGLSVLKVNGREIIGPKATIVTLQSTLGGKIVGDPSPKKKSSAPTIPTPSFSRVASPVFDSDESDESSWLNDSWSDEDTSDTDFRFKKYHREDPSDETFSDDDIGDPEFGVIAGKYPRAVIESEESPLANLRLEGETLSANRKRLPMRSPYRSPGDLTRGQSYRSPSKDRGENATSTGRAHDFSVGDKVMVPNQADLPKYSRGEDNIWIVEDVKIRKDGTTGAIRVRNTDSDKTMVAKKEKLVHYAPKKKDSKSSKVRTL